MDSDNKFLREIAIELSKLNNSILQQLLAFIDNKAATPDTGVGRSAREQIIENEKNAIDRLNDNSAMKDRVRSQINEYDIDESDNDTNEVIMMHLKAGMVISYEDGRRIPIQTDGTFRVFNGCKINWD